MFSLKVNNVDVSNYLVATDLVPFVERNRDYTLVLTELNFSFLENLGSGYLQEGYTVEVQELGSAYPFWVGFISKYQNDPDSKGHNIVAQHALYKLSTKLVTYENLHYYLVDSNIEKYNPNGLASNRATVQVIHLLETLNQYLTSGIQIDCSALENTTSNNNFIETITYTSLVDYNVYIKHLYFIEDMIWCINNNVATKHQNITSNPDYSINIPSMLDLFQWVVSSLGLVCYWSRSGATKRLMVTVGTDEIPSFSSNNIGHKFTDTLEAEETGYAYKVYFNDDHTKYISDLENELEEIESTVDDEGKTSIHTIYNLVFTYQKPNEDDGVVLGIEDFAQVDDRTSLQGKKYVYPFGSAYNGAKRVGMYNKKIISKTFRHNITEITSDYLFTVVNALKHKININKAAQSSEIRWEVTQ